MTIEVTGQEQTQEIQNNEVEETTEQSSESESTQDDELENDENETEESETSEEDEEGKEERPKRKGVRKRISKLVKEKNQARQEVEYWKNLALESSKKPERENSKQEQTSQVNDDLEPNPDDYDKPTDYYKAFAKWSFKQEQKELSKQSQQEKENQRLTEVQRKWQEQENKFKEDHEDYEDAVSALEDVYIDQGAFGAILESDIGAQIIYELGNNEELIEKLSTLRGSAAIKEIGKIEARLQSQPKKKITKTTKAPPPISTAKGSAKITKDINDPDLPFSEYVKLRSA
ncbi:MAG: hypothetical protein Unbinned5081contig1003_1 [Prokaryotic dsDNA virus sp.]|nr:MAG: hypothetical protein Unbinned5081contig1003_1 [Prokaryotic dsDNA virus sp.]|tara:strand:- start:20021 stop:20884 length:864 start_codon:yes stop_codon:yes gene_type:complete